MDSIFDLQAVSDKEFENVFYILAKHKKIARLSRFCDNWQAWFYVDKFTVGFSKLGDLLNYCERYFKRRQNEILS